MTDVPSPDEILAHWNAPARWRHAPDCWEYHPRCAMARIHGHLSIEVERLTAIVTTLQSTLADRTDERDIIAAELERAQPPISDDLREWIRNEAKVQRSWASSYPDHPTFAEAHSRRADELDALLALLTGDDRAMVPEKYDPASMMAESLTRSVRIHDAIHRSIDPPEASG